MIDVDVNEILSNIPKEVLPANFHVLQEDIAAAIKIYCGSVAFAQEKYGVSLDDARMILRKISDDQNALKMLGMLISDEKALENRKRDIRKAS